ncbi:MAG: hypothetical protein JRD93_05735 [Deltaproteobacteria bacterium]|nr:hypothetical protein [Deltaproteobacteria bacterium]MBW2661481.1 hypothetical protein [Deltaproteobacteria bacterium]
MIAKKKEFYGGIFMMLVFIIVMVIIFSPVFNGKNGLQYMDDLYNCISKGSAYAIPQLKEKADKFMGNTVNVTLAMKDDEQAEKTALLFKKAGVSVIRSGSELKVNGDFGGILSHCLDDADLMYYNNKKALVSKYSYNEREVVYNWWMALKAMDKDLKKQKKFQESKSLGEISKKGVELAYNYYKVEPQKVTDRLAILVFSLTFYVIYTLWYGFSIMFMFEGWGMKLEH